MADEANEAPPLQEDASDDSDTERSLDSNERSIVRFNILQARLLDLFTSLHSLIVAAWRSRTRASLQRVERTATEIADIARRLHTLDAFDYPETDTDESENDDVSL